MRTDYATLQLAIADHIATVTIDRPPVNAQDRQARDELTELFDALGDREEVRAVVLTAAGKTFSAGADIKERVGMSAAAGDYTRHNRITREYFYAVRDCAKPVIGAINGPAIGAGFVLMMSCDIVVATEDCWVQMPEVNVGLSGGMKFLTQHFGRSYARWMYFTSARVPAAELHRLGLIQAAVPRAALMDSAMQIAREIASKSPLAVQTAKYGFNTVEEMPDRDAYRFEQSLTVSLSRSAEMREQQRAFVEKRAPAAPKG
jgi:enoyl-CoA hydratase